MAQRVSYEASDSASLHGQSHRSHSAEQEVVLQERVDSSHSVSQESLSEGEIPPNQMMKAWNQINLLLWVSLGPICFVLCCLRLRTLLTLAFLPLTLLLLQQGLIHLHQSSRSLQSGQNLFLLPNCLLMSFKNNGPFQHWSCSQFLG